MILWRLSGYSDPRGECGGRDVVCSISKLASGYRRLVDHRGDVQADEIHASMESARRRAEALRAELTRQGWASV